MKTVVLFIFFGFFQLNGFCQETITVKYFGLAIHPFGDSSAKLQPRKLDKNAHFVLNTGLFVGYEKFFYRDYLSLKIIQGVTSDCSNGWAVISHIGVRALLMKAKKHRVYFGVGPAFIARESWTRFGEDYTPSGFFNEYSSLHFGQVQWKFLPIAGELEYDYCFNDKNQLSFSLTPGVPATTISVGWKHWFHLKKFDEIKIYIPRR